MSFSEDTRLLNSEKNWPISRLKKVISDLKECSDIEGAVMVKGKDAIIACELPEEKNYEAHISRILALLEDWDASALSTNSNDMFAHCILEYNGCKILAKRLKNDLTLLVMLRKRGYIGLAMLDIENSIRRIDEILQGDVMIEQNRAAINLP